MSDLRERAEREATNELRERVARLRLKMEEAASALEEPLQIPIEASAWAADCATEIVRVLRDVLERMSRARSQRDILSPLLDAAAKCFPRAALFVVKGEALVGWAGRGFEDADGAGDGAMAKLAIPGAADHILARALQAGGPVMARDEGPGEAVLKALGVESPQGSIALPLLVRGRPVAVLYGDTGTHAGTEEALLFEIVGRVGSLALEALTAALPHRTTTPRAARVGGEAEPELPPSKDDARPPPPTPPEEGEMRVLLGDLDDQPQGPASGADEAIPEEERRHHDDARRFASLLVSELLLYNEEAVILGRQNRDLSKRLAAEIERSRQAYAARVPTGIIGPVDYFEDEIVRVLAEGDRSLLGSR